MSGACNEEALALLAKLEQAAFTIAGAYSRSIAAIPIADEQAALAMGGA